MLYDFEHQLIWKVIEAGRVCFSRETREGESMSYVTSLACWTYELFSVGTKYDNSGFDCLATVRLFFGALLDCLLFNPVLGGVPWGSTFDGVFGARVRDRPAITWVV